MKVINRRKLMKLTKKELIDQLEMVTGDKNCMEMELEIARNEVTQDKIEIERLQDRIKFLSTCFDTLDQKGKVGQIKTFKTEERTITAEDFGQYIAMATMNEELINHAKEKIINEIAEALVENGIVQFIVKRPNEVGGPAEMVGTVAAKLFFIPWEKMAYRTTRVKWVKI